MPLNTICNPHCRGELSVCRSQVADGVATIPEKNKAGSSATGSVNRILQRLGPGLVTGASDDDPSGIGTYSHAGAQLGFAIGWSMLLAYPLMVAIQEISARIGRTTGHGIAGNLGRHYPNWPAGSAAYAIGEARRWPVGLSRQPRQAVAFYATLTAATGLGVAITLGPIDPIKALYWTAVINGVIGVPVMAVMMLMTAQSRVMGRFVIKGWLRWLGWSSTLVVGACAIGMVVGWFV
jgi:Mn2+/Fe2+ NRAMP family transporter